LSWTNRSAAAEQIAVKCSSCALPGTLPAASTSYLDATFPPWPEAVYQLEAFLGPSIIPVLRPDLPTIALPPFRIDGGLVTLDARRSPHPGFTSSPAGDGAWYRLGYTPAGPTVDKVDDVGTTSFVVGGDVFLEREPFFDGAGHPHVYARVNGSAVQEPQLAHAWHDGATWHQEVASPPWPVFGDWFAPGVDGSGVSHVVYKAMGGQMVHGIGTAGGWSWTVLPEFGDLFGSLVVTADGWAHFAFPNRIWSRPPGGDWAFEDSPTSAWQVAAEGGGDLAIYGWTSQVGLVKDVVYVERRAGAWGAVETVATTNTTHAVPSAARSPDGARVFMAISVPDGVSGSRLDLFGRVGGAWQAMRLGPTQGTVNLGFTPSGKLRATSPAASWLEP
jgi:hypothetical protein